jgi:uncharacterized damage-inducible protein DinB
MNEVERITDQVAAGYRNGAWVNVSVRDLLLNLSPAEAAARPIVGAHSAWEIALHLAFWHDAVRRRLGGETVDYRPEEDWPTPGEPTDANWHAALEGLDEAHQALVNAVQTLNPDKLDQLVPGKSFTVYCMLHGIPQHDLYHGGQIMLLRKAIRTAPGQGSA